MARNRFLMPTAALLFRQASPAFNRLHPIGVRHAGSSAPAIVYRRPTHSVRARRLCATRVPARGTNGSMRVATPIRDRRRINHAAQNYLRSISMRIPTADAARINVCRVTLSFSGSRRRTSCDRLVSMRSAMRVTGFRYCWHCGQWYFDTLAPLLPRRPTIPLEHR